MKNLWQGKVKLEMKPIIRKIEQTVCHNCGDLTYIAKRSDTGDCAIFYMDKISIDQKFDDGKIFLIEKIWGHKCK